MHIVFVTAELASTNNATGGLGTFTANMASMFASNGHKVTIILSTVKEDETEFDHDNITLIKLYVRKTIWDFWAKLAVICSFGKKDNKEIRAIFIDFYRSGQIRKEIRKINKKNRIDIVHYCNLYSLALRANKKIPYVIRISGIGFVARAANMPVCNINYEDNQLSKSEIVLHYTMKKARYIISPSNIIADIERKRFGIEATVIESPFLLQTQNLDFDCLNHYGLKEKKYIIHYGGQLRFLKGTHVVAKLARELLQKYPDLYIVLAGVCENMQDEAGNVMKAHELVKQEAGEYADRVIYVGSIVREQLYPMIQNAELCLLPSRTENLANACIEAMAMGRIVVATDGASYEQLIDNGMNGFLCERDNPESFLRGIEAALTLNEEEKSLIESNAIETVKRLRPDNIYKQYLDFYEKVINEW